MMNMPGAEVATTVAGKLSLAAAPVFAAMALVTGPLGGDQANMMCPAGASPLGGMAAMYVLMSVFHLAPWLNLLARRRNAQPQE